MISRGRMLGIIVAGTAGLVAAPDPAPDKPKLKPKPKGKGPGKPTTPQEIRAQKAFEAMHGKAKQAGHHYPTSPKAMQHAGQHKNTGTPKGHKFKR